MHLNRLLATLALLCVPALALAHPGHGDNGLVAGIGHPLGGLDHLLAMLAVGWWAAQQPGAARWALPCTFVASLLIGGLLGFAGLVLVVSRKFGAGGPFDPGQKGRYKATAAVRGSAARIDAEAIEITTLMADYVLSTFGRFPATVPAVFLHTYLQAHRLDTEFYDTHFGPGAYLRTHAEHDRNWS